MQKLISIIFLSILFITLSYAQDSVLANLNIKVFLEGPFNNDKMETSLREKNLIPAMQPYNVLPWNYNGTEKITNFPDNTVDWVLVELSKEPNESAVTNRKACVLKSNGDIADTGSKMGITLKVQKNSKYYIIVHHRNHLSVISSIPLNFSGGNLSYDFTNSGNSAFGESSLVNLGRGIYCMPTGDSDANGIINNQDFKAIGKNIFNKGYNNCDLDMNGIVNVLDYGQTNINISKRSYIPAKSP